MANDGYREPQEAARVAYEDAAKAIDPAAFDETLPNHGGAVREYRREQARSKARVALDAALPHLRSLQAKETTMPEDKGFAQGYVTLWVSIEMLAHLEADWSAPCQIRMDRTPGIGSGYEMTFRTHTLPAAREGA